MASARVNAALLVVIAAWLIHRATKVGVIEAAAELIGIAQMPAYVDWRDAYRPLHRDLFSMPLHAVIEPSLAQALSLNDLPARRAALRRLVTSHGHAVFTVPLLRVDACTRFAEEARHFAASEQGAGAARPNSMNRYGIVLGPDGLDGLNALLAQIRVEVLSPLVDALFQSPEGGAEMPAAYHAAAAAASSEALVEEYAFIVRYNESEQQSLDMHHDASDVTLNVCLESEADEEREDQADDEGHVEEHGSRDDDSPGVIAASSGLGVGLAAERSDAPPSQLRFCGLVGDVAHRRRSVTLSHAVGTAVIHLGAHRHGTTPIRRGGLRQNLIMWARQVRAARTAEGSSQGEERYRASLSPEELPPDAECLSWTHDVDFELYRALPPEAVEERARQRHNAELLELASRATDEHIAALPPSHQPIVLMLRQVARQQAQEEATRRNHSPAQRGGAGGGLTSPLVEVD